MTCKKGKFRILTCYYRPKPGGFCKRLFRAINALLCAGHEVHYLAVVRFPIDHPSCHFHRFPWPKNHTSGYIFWGFFHIFAPIQLLFVGLMHQINYLFAFGGHNYALFLQPIKIFRRIPLTIFLRGDAIEKHKVNGRPSLLVGVEHFLEGLGIAGTRMYGVSEALTNKIIARHRLLRPLKSGVLRNDIVKDLAKLSKTRKVQLPLRLACVGVLEPGKNQQFLLKVMKTMKANQAQLYLYGVGPDEQLLQKTIIEEKLSNRVYFMGWVESDNIWPDIDLLLMPSLHEGAPNAALEAIANCVPVLASDIPEHFEIFSKKSLLPLGKPLRWVKKIEHISHDPKNQLQNLISEQRNATQHLMFDWEQEVIKCIV